MPKLTIVIGANGAGKSTWCSSERKHLPKHFYNADSIARGLGDWNDADLQQDARDVVDGKIESHLERREDFGFESTYSGKSRPSIVKRAAESGYEVATIFIGTTNHKINIERVEKRVSDGTGHKVQKSEIVRRWTVAQDNLAATARHMTSIELLDNSSKSCRQVGMLTRDSTRTWGNDRPNWATKLTEKIVRTDPTLAGPSHNSQYGPEAGQEIARSRTTNRRGYR